MLQVDVLGKRLVVGTRRLGVVEQGKGLAYVFQNNGSSWLAETQLAPESSSGGGAVGGAVAIQESRILLSHGTPMSDLQPPEVSSMLPANMDQVVETQNVTELRIIFSETIVKDSDTAAFRIFQKVAPQASVINITVGSDQVRLENSDKAQLLDGEHKEGSYGDTVVVNVGTDTLLPDHEYYILVDNGAFADLAILPNIWEGVFDEDDWTFRMGGGCYVTKTGCSVQGDKTFFQTFRDWKGEAEKNALTSQEACLLRARVHHVGCQQPVELPTRVLFEATGATRAFPPGCWISQPSCSNESAANKLGLYQDKDESVMLSGVDHEAACFARAKVHSELCQNPVSVPTVAEYRGADTQTAWPLGCFITAEVCHNKPELEGITAAIDLALSENETACLEHAELVHKECRNRPFETVYTHFRRTNKVVGAPAGCWLRNPICVDIPAKATPEWTLDLDLEAQANRSACLQRASEAHTKCNNTCSMDSQAEFRGLPGGAQMARTTFAAVHCKVAEWGPYGTCSRPCGTGRKIRHRTILQHPCRGGNSCPDTVGMDECNTHVCPMPCEVAPWIVWGQCSAECEGGEQIRTRKVMQPPIGTGTPCPELEETRVCNTEACSAACELSDWGKFGRCSAACGANEGVQTRYRKVITPDPKGRPCGKVEEKRVCNSAPCPVHCQLSDWAEFSNCTKVCGSGSQSRYRSVTVEPEYGGTECASLNETRVCNSQPCKVLAVDVVTVTEEARVATADTVAEVAEEILQKQQMSGGLLERAQVGLDRAGEVVASVGGEPAAPWAAKVVRWIPLLDSKQLKQETLFTFGVRRLDEITAAVTAGNRIVSQLRAEENEVGAAAVERATGSMSAAADSLQQLLDAAAAVRQLKQQAMLATKGGAGGAKIVEDNAKLKREGEELKQAAAAAAAAVAAAIASGDAAAIASAKAAETAVRAQAIANVQQQKEAEAEVVAMTRMVELQKDVEGAVQSKSDGASVQVTVNNLRAAEAAVQEAQGDRVAMVTQTAAAQVQATAAALERALTSGDPAVIAAAQTTANAAARSLEEAEGKLACIYTPWQQWNPCSERCGGGDQSRTRAVTNQAEVRGVDGAEEGANCGRIKESRRCNTNMCGVNDCQLSEWSPFGVCSATCGGGLQSRTRTVTSPSAAGGAAGCGDLSESRECGTGDDIHSHVCTLSYCVILLQRNARLTVNWETGLTGQPAQPHVGAARKLDLGQ